MDEKEKIPEPKELVEEEPDEYYSESDKQKNKKANKKPIRSGEYAKYKF